MYVYYLLDPRDNRIRYIGTTNNPESRLEMHLRHGSKYNDEKRDWQLELLQLGLVPRLRCILKTTPEYASTVEFRLAKRLKAKGYQILNKHDTWSDQKRRSNEAFWTTERRRIQAQKQSVQWTEERRKRHSEAMRKSWASKSKDVIRHHMQKMRDAKRSTTLS